jgi:hypothetical protein
MVFFLRLLDINCVKNSTKVLKKMKGLFKSELGNVLFLKKKGELNILPFTFLSLSVYFINQRFVVIVYYFSFTT